MNCIDGSVRETSAALDCPEVAGVRLESGGSDSPLEGNHNLTGAGAEAGLSATLSGSLLWKHIGDGLARRMKCRWHPK